MPGGTTKAQTLKKQKQKTNKPKNKNKPNQNKTKQNKTKQTNKQTKKKNQEKTNKQTKNNNRQQQQKKKTNKPNKTNQQTNKQDKTNEKGCFVIVTAIHATETIIARKTLHSFGPFYLHTRKILYLRHFSPITCTPGKITRHMNFVGEADLATHCKKTELPHNVCM